MAAKFLLIAGTAVIVNGISVVLDNDVECEVADPSISTVDQLAEAAKLGGLNIDLTHVDDSGDVPVAVSYAPADAARIETPITEDAPAPADAPTKADLTEGAVTVPVILPTPVVEEQPAEVVETEEAPAEVVETAPVEEFPENPFEPAPETTEPETAEVTSEEVVTAPEALSPEAQFEANVQTAEKEFEAEVKNETQG